jgi:hypothetical protein
MRGSIYRGYAKNLLQEMALGKLLYEGRGQQGALRILDANGSVEASGSDTGQFKDADLNCVDYWTVKVKLEFDGTDIGEGNGLMFVQDGEIVFYTTSFTGRTTSSGRSVRGSVNFQTGSTGTLSSLDDKVGVIELEFEPDNSYSFKIWEWN